MEVVVDKRSRSVMMALGEDLMANRSSQTGGAGHEEWGCVLVAVRCSTRKLQGATPWTDTFTSCH